MYKKQIFLLLVLSFANLNINAEFLERSIDKNKERFSKVALDIWEFAEMGYQETKSSALLASELEKEGFKITKNVANIPTAFIAEYGSGGPIIGILGEFDALPGLAQSNSPFKEIVAMELALGMHAVIIYLVLLLLGLQLLLKNGLKIIMLQEL